MLVSAILLLAASGIQGFPEHKELRTKRQTIEDVGTKVGCLVTRSHKVSGEVYYINKSSQLYIKDFTFDGLGFGVHFYAGKICILLQIISLIHIERPQNTFIIEPDIFPHLTQLLKFSIRRKHTTI